jgi:hypothetical protein
VVLSPAGRWAVYEWFYSDIDRVYFQVNDFQECLNDLGLSKIRKLTRVEWAQVRSAMGKPRRLSRAFLKQERNKLYNTRNNVRAIRQGEAPVSSISLFPLPHGFPFLSILSMTSHIRLRPRPMVESSQANWNVHQSSQWGPTYWCTTTRHSKRVWFRQLKQLGLDTGCSLMATLTSFGSKMLI